MTIFSLKQQGFWKGKWITVSLTLALGILCNLFIRPIDNKVDAIIIDQYYGRVHFKDIFTLTKDSSTILGCFYKDEVNAGISFFDSNLNPIKDYHYGSDKRTSVFDFHHQDLDSLLAASVFPNTQMNVQQPGNKYFKVELNNNRLPRPTMNYGYECSDNNSRRLNIVPWLDGAGFYILNRNGKHLADITLPYNRENQTLNFTSLSSLKGRHSLLVQGQQNLYLMSIRFNVFYYTRFIIRSGLFVLIFLFIRLIQKLQERSDEKKELLNRKLINLQLRSINNQIDPHFTFNVLNTLSSLDLDKGDPEKVKKFIYDSLTLFRKELLNSEEANVTLENELTFVRNYFRIQQFYRPDIELKITIDKALSKDLQIPKTIVFSHVENAIKHGFPDKSMHGFISIEVNAINKGMQISIEDTGIGRSSMGNNRGTGTGMRTINQIISLYKELFAIDIRQEIIDLKDPSGTKVIIQIK